MRSTRLELIYLYDPYNNVVDDYNYHDDNYRNYDSNTVDTTQRKKCHTRDNNNNNNNFETTVTNYFNTIICELLIDIEECKRIFLFSSKKNKKKQENLFYPILLNDFIGTE